MHNDFAIKDTTRRNGGQPGPAADDFPTDDAWAVEEAIMLEEERLQKLVNFGGALGKLRDEWIAARAATGWDKRVQEDLDQYEGRDTANRMAAEMMNSVEQGYPVTTQHARATRSTVYINITRPKTNASEARVADIVLPTDEENWAIHPTPNPTLVKIAMDDKTDAIDPMTGQPIPDPDNPGQNVKLKEVAAAVQKMAREKSEAMTRTIHDQLVEFDYHAEVRKVIHDAAKMGVGVLKGPCVESRTRTSWQPVAGSTFALVQLTEEKPVSWRVDPRNVWEDPACGDDIQAGKGIFEREIMPAKRLRELAKQPGYLPDQIAMVLAQGPQLSLARYSTQDKREQLQMSTRPYEVWTWTGEVDVDDYRVALPQGNDGNAVLDEEDALQKLEKVSACIVFVNNVVIKAYENPNESGDLPYDFFPWEKEVDSARGVGVPFLLRSQQKVITAAWRMLMDNAGMSVGPQIIMKRGVVQPADGQWQIAARKIWFASEDVDDVEKAMQAIEFNTRQPELAAIIQAAESMADTETGTPMLAQGERGTAPDTLGGMQLLMNNTNVVLRRIVKQFDDYLTKPHIRRYYDFNMAYSDDPEIKGDMDVDARGSSALLVRDVQNQAMTNLLAAGGNPIYAPFINAKKLFTEALKAQKIQPEMIMYSDDEMAENARKAAENPPPGDPRIEAARMTAEARVAEAMQRTETQKAIQQERLAEMREERALRVEQLKLERDLAMLKLANEKQISLEEIKAHLAESAMSQRTKRDLFAREERLRLMTGAGI